MSDSNPIPGNKKWVKGGPSPNPGGRTRGLERIFQEELRAVQQRFETQAADGTATEEILDGYRATFRRLWLIAMAGEAKDSLVAIKLLLERAHGMPKQKVTITDDDSTAQEANWSAVPVEKRREFLETLELVAPSSDVTEH